MTIPYGRYFSGDESLFKVDDIPIEADPLTDLDYPCPSGGTTQTCW